MMHKLFFAILFVGQLSFGAVIELHDFVIRGTSANGEAPNYYAFPESVKPLAGGIFRSPVGNTLMVCSDRCWSKSENMARKTEVNSHLLTFVNESLIFQESDGHK